MPNIPNPKGKGFPRTPEEKQGMQEKLVERRAIIKNIIEARGWQSMRELHRVLTTEYTYADGSPITISRQTLYNDLDVIGNEMDIAGRESSNLVAAYTRELRELGELLKTCKTVKEQIAVRSLRSRIRKDFSVVLGRLGAKASADAKGGEKQEQEYTIAFEDKVEDE